MNLLLAISVSAMATLPPGEASETPHLHHVVDDESDLIATSVATADGRWHYELSSSFPETFRRGRLSFTYIDQASFLFTDAPRHPPRIEQEPPACLENGPAQMVDRLGRRWEVTTISDRFESDACNTAQPDEEQVSSVMEPLSWSTFNCGSNIQQRIWDTESRTCRAPDCANVGVGQGYPDQAHRNAVSIALIGAVATTNGQLDFKALARCSGALVADDWVLTAAHCLNDSTGNSWAPNWTRVCTKGNGVGQYAGAPSQCTSALEIHRPSNSGNTSNDYAMIRLSSGLLHTGDDPYEVEIASANACPSCSVRTAGYPGRFAGEILPLANPSEDYCDPPTGSGSLGIVLEPYAGDSADGWIDINRNWLYSQSHSFVSYTASRIRTKFDAVKGQSGSPIYVRTGGVDRIVGVLANFNSTTNRYVGPKSDRFYQFVDDRL